jgi:APA family basic amino acid/polyamine antiporter
MSTNAEAVIDPPINVDPPTSERQLGLPMATALVVGNVIGAGIFLLPAVLAPYGQNALPGWIVSVAGALFIAATLALLSRHIEGGPFVYVEEAFGTEISFVVMWSYLVSIWTANATLAIAAVSNFSHIIPALGGEIAAPLVGVAIVWALTLVNSRGARTAGAVQLVTSVLKALPLIVVVIIAAVVWGHGAAPAPEIPVPLSAGSIAAAASLALFSMVGVESAAVSADKVKNPRRTIPIASVLGAAATGLIFIAATWAVLYLLPGKATANSASPFADASLPFVGPAAGSAIALFAAISALGCLNGWVLCAGELPLKLARDGAFPAWFAKTAGSGTPVRAQVLAAVVATLMIVMSSSRSMAGIFALLTLISVVASLVLYTGCSAAALTLLARGKLRGALLGVCATVALVFSFWTYWGAGLEATLWGLALIASGVPLWFAVRRTPRVSPATSRPLEVAAAAPRE